MKSQFRELSSLVLFVRIKNLKETLIMCWEMILAQLTTPPPVLGVFI